MEIVYVFDEDGYLDRPVLLELVETLGIPEDRYTKEIPGDFIRARWIGRTWVEGADEAYLEHLDSIRGENEPTPIETVKEELEKMAGEKTETQMAVAELTETMFSEINSIKTAIAELAILLVPPEPPEEEEPQPEEPPAEETNPIEEPIQEDPQPEEPTDEPVIEEPEPEEGTNNG